MTGVAMDRGALHPVPRRGAAFREQLAVTGMAMWREGVLLLAFAAVAAWTTISECQGIAEHWRATRLVASGPDESAQRMLLGIEIFGSFSVAVLALAALFLPAAVWRGGQAARRDYLAAMPLPAAPHALLKVAAGWTWAMAGVALFSLAMAGTVLVAMGLLGDAPVTVHVRGRGSEAWLWLVPFTAVTFTYLLGSAIALAARHPWRLVLLVVGAALAATAAATTSGIEGAIAPLGALFAGRFGLNAAVAATKVMNEKFEVGPNHTFSTMLSVPDFDRWVPALMLWLSIALAAVIVAAYRRRD